MRFHKFSFLYFQIDHACLLFCFVDDPLILSLHFICIMKSISKRLVTIWVSLFTLLDSPDLHISLWIASIHHSQITNPTSIKKLSSPISPRIFALHMYIWNYTWIRHDMFFVSFSNLLNLSSFKTYSRFTFHGSLLAEMLTSMPNCAFKIKKEKIGCTIES